MTYKPCNFDRNEYLENAEEFEAIELMYADKEMIEHNNDAESLAFELAYTRYQLAKAELTIANKKSNSFAGVDSRLTFRDDQMQNLADFNEEYKTNYKYISEAMQKSFLLNMPVWEIAENFEMTKAGIYNILRKLGTDIKKRVGCKCKIQLTTQEIAEIRDKKNKAYRMAAKYNMSSETFYCIRRRKGRWAEL